MDVAEGEIEVSALTSDSLEKLQNHLHKVLIKQSDATAFNTDDDNRYADFAECISKMQGNDSRDEARSLPACLRRSRRRGRCQCHRSSHIQYMSTNTKSIR